MQAEAKGEGGEYSLSDEEKEQILSKIETETTNIQKDIDDISLGIQE
jgi:hypothetical protein